MSVFDRYREMSKRPSADVFQRLGSLNAIQPQNETQYGDGPPNEINHDDAVRSAREIAGAAASLSDA